MQVCAYYARVHVFRIPIRACQIAVYVLLNLTGYLIYRLYFALKSINLCIKHLSLEIAFIEPQINAYFSGDRIL